jgi:DNA-binding NarL/FixJ family response regulator
MKALLIDDERLARNELRRLLAAHPEITIAGEAANPKQAREQIAALRPTCCSSMCRCRAKPAWSCSSRSSRPCRT